MIFYIIKFIDVLFMRVKKYNYLSCLLINEWIIKLWFIYIINFYLVYKKIRNYIVGKVMDLESVLLMKVV